jgi:hypothetical protein
MADHESFPNRIVLIPGPSFHVDLPALDARHMVHYSRRLLIFRCASSAQRAAQLVALERGLHTLLQACPVLGGLIAPLPDSVPGKADWRTILPHDGLPLHVRDLRPVVPPFSTLEADNFPPAALPYALFMPVPADIDARRPYAACEVQFSAIRGGTVLTFAMSHTVADGAGTDAWMRVLAAAVCRAQETLAEDAVASPVQRMGEDRSILLNMTSDTAFNIAEHPAYRWKTLYTAAPPPPHPFGTAQAEVPVLLHVPISALARLKADATPRTPSALISTHDALVALIWRSTLLVRSRRSSAAAAVWPDTPTQLFMPSDARRHLGLGADYVGNAVYQLTASMPLGELLGPDGLARAAGALRRAISAVTPARVRSYIAATNAAGDMERALEYQWTNGTVGNTGVALGTGLGSGESVYGSAWGAAFGAVERFRQTSGPPAYVLPRRPDGSVELVVNVLPEEEVVLRGAEGFGRYLT